MPEVPERAVRHEMESGDIEAAPGLVGIAESRRYDRAITRAEQERWRKEDEERDRRRIPLGFRAADTNE